MGQLFVYSILSGVILALMYLIYKITLAAENQPAYNRAVILLIYVVTLTAPLFPQALPGIVERVAVETPATLAAMIEGVNPIIATSPAPENISPAIENGAVWLPKVLSWIYMAGVAVTALLTMITALKLHMVIRGGERLDCNGLTLIIYDTPGMAPFSWGHYVIMNRGDFEEAAGPIMAHEQCHIESLHWIDLLVAQLVIILQWYNPAAWLMRGELQLVHEYQADAAVIRSGADLRQYQMLLIKKAVGGRFQSLANSLNHSNLKKRITMMYKTKSKVGRRFRALALVPAALVALAVVANPAVTSALDTVSDAFNTGKVIKNSVTDETNKENKEKVYAVADVAPKYPGGESELLFTLSKNLKYPENASKEKKQGIVVVKFVVNSKGEVKDPSILRSVSPEIDAEAKRVISTLGKFTPGTVGGKAVSTYYTLPIHFRLN